MSVEQVKAFFDKLKDDAALAQKLKDAQAAYKGDTSDKAAAVAAVVIPVAAEAGFNFTAEEFKAAFDKGEGEASADELDAVAGGNSFDECVDILGQDWHPNGSCQPIFNDTVSK